MAARNAVTGITLGVMLLMACGGGTSPSPNGSLTITGAEQSDTVSAFLPTPLTVRVLTSGKPVLGATVSLSTIPDAMTRLGVLYLDLLSGAALNYAQGQTDAAGRFATNLRFGGAAGRAGVIVTVTNPDFTDTVYFNVLPGRPAMVTGLSLDTALQVGRSTTLPTSGVTDRYNNPRTDPVSYQTLSASVSLNGATLTALSIDRARVLVRAGTYSDTVRISVVPVAELAAGGTQVSFFQSDYTSYRRVPNTGGFVEWVPDGSEVFSDGVNVSGSWLGSLKATRPDGSTRPSFPPPPGVLSIWIPRYARDGSELYFTAVTGVAHDVHFRVWRMRVDGSRTEPVPGIPEAETTMAAPSPDGKRLAYVALIGSGQIRMLDLEHGVPIPFSVSGHSPRWSPTGALIGFVTPDDGDKLKVMAPDGSSIRTVSEPGGRYDLGFDWSPDGQWIVAKEMFRQRVTLINVVTGLVLPLPVKLDAILGPVWRPAQP